jgi:hypothetical protein
MTTEKNDYAARVVEAEAAVKSVKDPELRRVAFQKILEHLLQGDARSSATPRKKSGGSAGRPPAEAKTGGAKGRDSASRKGPKGRLVELVEEGFFKKQRTIAEVKTELANRGHHIPLTSLSGPLQSLTQDRRLRRQKVPSTGKGSKTTYAYSNW